MRCPHLVDRMVSFCKADDKPYVPSIYELQEYCTAGKHQRCPLFISEVDIGEEELSSQSGAR